MSQRINKKALFLRLAHPDENGFSRWVSKREFVGEFRPLYFDNGFPWGRRGTSLDNEFIVETDDTQTPGNAIDRIGLNGKNPAHTFRQNIRQDIREAIKQRKCVMLGVCGNSVNNRIEPDHKNSRKNDPRVNNTATQCIEDFQPLCKAANTMKRQACKDCKESGIRWDAKNIEGNPVSYYQGDEHYTDELGCVGCYLYDPVEYRRVTYARKR